MQSTATLSLLCDCSLALPSPFPLGLLVEVSTLIGVLLMHSFKKFWVYLWGLGFEFRVEFCVQVLSLGLNFVFKFKFSL